jgi:tetratricopeptide (TPR) repeat protein
MRVILIALTIVLSAGCRSKPTAIENTSAPSWSANERLIAKIEDTLRRDGERPEWMTALGHAYLQRTRETGDPSYYTKAEELFERAIAANENHDAAWTGQASLAMSRHEFTSARELANQAIRRNPGSAAAHGILADALIELGEYDLAVQALDTMVWLKPNISSYSRISYLRELTGDIIGAEKAMQMAIDAGAPDAENTAWCIVQLGNLYLSSGRASEAYQAYRAALGRFPDYIHAYAGLAKVAVAKRDFEEAVRHYEKAIWSVPLPEFLINLGELYLRMGRRADAQRQFETVDAIQKIYRSNGVAADAVLALFEADRGDVKRALVMAAAEWKKTKSVKTADVYAWTLFRAGRYVEAQEMIQQALRLGTKDPLFLFHAGMIARSRGDRDTAFRYLSEAMRLNPGFSAIHAAEAEMILAEDRRAESR